MENDTLVADDTTIKPVAPTDDTTEETAPAVEANHDETVVADEDATEEVAPEAEVAA